MGVAGCGGGTVGGGPLEAIALAAASLACRSRLHLEHRSSRFGLLRGGEKIRERSHHVAVCGCGPATHHAFDVQMAAHARVAALEAPHELATINLQAWAAGDADRGA